MNELRTIYLRVARSVAQVSTGYLKKQKAFPNISQKIWKDTVVQNKHLFYWLVVPYKATCNPGQVQKGMRWHLSMNSDSFEGFFYIFSSQQKKKPSYVMVQLMHMQRKKGNKRLSSKLL